MSTDPTFDPNAGQNTGPLYEAVGEFPAGRFARAFPADKVADLADKWGRLSMVDRALLGEKVAGAPDSDLGVLAQELAGAPAVEAVDATATPSRLTIAETKAAVGDDVEKARVWLLTEHADSDPRSTLVSWLEGVIDAGTVTPDPPVSLGSVHDTLGVDGDTTL